MLDFSAISNRSVWGRALRFPLKLIPSGANVRILQGPLRGQRWIVGAGVHGYWLGSFEREKGALLTRLVPRNSIVFDVGANVGYYTLLASSLVGEGGHVYAFEPMPRNVDYLRRHVALNARGNVTIVPVAVAGSSGVAAFDGSGDPSMGRLAPSGRLRVDTVTLDGLLATGSVHPPAVIKIDVEGAELSVLEGSAHLLRTHRPIILLATHGPELSHACTQLLGEFGYAVTPLTGDDIHQSSEFLARPVRGRSRD